MPFKFRTVEDILDHIDHQLASPLANAITIDRADAVHLLTSISSAQPPRPQPERNDPMTATEPVTAIVALPYQSERLRQLHASYAEARAAADAASERLKTITDAIKTELQTTAVGAGRILLPAEGTAPALRLTRTESWRLDSTRLKREHLDVWVQYAKKSESWVLRPVAGGAQE